AGRLLEVKIDLWLDGTTQPSLTRALLLELEVLTLANLSHTQPRHPLLHPQIMVPEQVVEASISNVQVAALLVFHCHHLTRLLRQQFHKLVLWFLELVQELLNCSMLLKPFLISLF